MPPSSAARRLDTAASVFAALGDGTRLRLVSKLCDAGPSSITELAASSEVTRQAVTKHLRLLEEAGLVRSARSGRETIWELEPARLEMARRHLAAVSERWDAALSRLARFVEE